MLVLIREGFRPAVESSCSLSRRRMMGLEKSSFLLFNLSVIGTSLI
jgi:hypothetical protein